MQPFARRTLMILLAAAAAVLIAAAVTWPGLPGAVTMLWSLAGRPAWRVSRWAAVAILTGIPLFFAAVTAALATRNVVPLMRIGFAAVGTQVTVLTALRSVFTLAVTGRYPAAVIILAGAAEVAIGVLAGLHVAMAPAAAPEALPSWPPGRGRPPLWRGAAAARRPACTALVFFALGFAALFIFADAGGLIFGIGMIVGGTFVLSLTAVVVEIDDRELRVHYFGGARWPVTRLAVPSIREVEVVDVDPPRSGGWGYRGSLRLQRAAALNVRRGPGLRLRLDGGRRFQVTVGDAGGGARVLGQFVTAQ